MRADRRLAVLLVLALSALSPMANAEVARPGDIAAAAYATALPGPLRQIKAFGPSAPPLRERISRAADDMPMVLKQSIACLVLGSSGTAAAAMVGAENLVNVVGGGLVVTRNRIVLALGVAGVVFGTFCAVGGALTPLYLELVE